ncbi:hypothetical protein CTAYLR_006562 [Chrysophaeum taylorii]|uniref:Endonuclease n=1 Tax=Chrysophaeum taylorii TaxID=2483200 RepID=A0AAD7UG49_9STRA|nr:hypothetical protein CTAYLR_006562 [Chrysophaeum taylorii]
MTLRRGAACLGTTAAAAATTLSWCRKDEEFGGEILKHPALAHGFPQTNYVAASESFVACFDFRTRNPAWVVEHLTNASVRLDEAKRETRFREFEGIPERMRSRLSDYAGSGFDRGHLAPAANHKHSQDAMRDTFSLLNISPQVGVGFNRDYWARVEKFVRDVAKKGVADKVTVVTGPLFLGSAQQTIGTPPSLVHVPTHFFKIVLAETTPRAVWSGGGYAVAAFVVPNKPIQPDTPLTDFLAPLEAVEAAAGMVLFGRLLTPDRRAKLRADEAKYFLHKSKTTKAAQMLLLPDGGGSPPPAPDTSKLPTDITHLCDRHKCDLVAAKWLDQFKQQDDEGGGD